MSYCTICGTATPLLSSAGVCVQCQPSVGYHTLRFQSSQPYVVHGEPLKPVIRVAPPCAECAAKDQEITELRKQLSFYYDKGAK